MSSLKNKIDFAVIFRVKNANPNGDPLNGNRPRTDYEEHGEISDVCLKRKMRDRLMEEKDEKGNYKYQIFIQSNDRKLDDATSLNSRAKKALGEKLGGKETIALACEKWLDVRAFGQLFAFKKNQNDDETEDPGISIPIRGPVAIHHAYSVDPVSIASTQITKSVNGNDTKNGKKSSDTMGMKHRVDFGIYSFFGSMNPQLAEKTNFSELDALAIKGVLPKLFENDSSSQRPEGSMEILKVIWWEQIGSGKYSSAKVHGSLKIKSDGSYTIDNLGDLKPEEINGF